MRIDHVSYAVSNGELADTVQRLGQQLGAAFTDGGRHPRFGTRNFVLPLGDGCYIEVVSPLDHPAVDSAPFGQAVKARANDGGGWLGWVVNVQDIAAVEARLGRSAADGHRVRPDGVDIRWRQIGIKDLLDDAQLPFFIQWLSPDAERPSSGGKGMELQVLEIAGDEASLEAWLGGPIGKVLDGVHIEWVQAEEPGLVAVHVATPHGVVRLD